MDDKTILEMAAVAAGVRFIKPADGYTGAFGLTTCDEHQRPVRDWNPLHDDGDAFRLAMTLRISIDHNDPAYQQRYVVAERCGREGCYSPVCAIEDDFDEKHRGIAARRAIVRAAAEIGRQSNES